MPLAVPTMEEFTSLDNRVKKLEVIAPPAALKPSPAWSQLPATAGLSALVLHSSEVVRLTSDKKLTIDDAPMSSTTNVDCVYVDDSTPSRVKHHSTDAPNYWWMWNPQAKTWSQTTDTHPDHTAPPIQSPLIRLRVKDWLKSLATNKLLSGQMCHADLREVKEMYKQLGIMPAMIGVDPWMDQWGTAPYYIYDTSYVPACMKHWDDGGLIQQSSFFPNPSGVGGSITAGSPTEILKRGSAQNIQLFKFFDLTAAPLRSFKGHGMAVPYRPFLEQDGTWFWWSNAYFTVDQFAELWKMHHAYFTVDLGFDHLLWTQAVNGGPKSYKFVGEQWVDIVGIDAYTDHPDSQAYVNLYNRLVTEAPNSVVWWTEYGSGTP